MTFLVLASSAVLLSALFAGAWWVSMARGNAGWVDVVWSGSLALLAVAYGLLIGGGTPAGLLVALLGGLWGARLFWHLARRVAGEEEDGRYRQLRSRWGDQARRNFFWFFQAQALAAWLFGLVFWAAASSPAGGMSPWLWLGVLVWVIAVAGESLADAQLSRCKQSDAGQVCRSGLWRYSRHPNYFFEWLHWFTYPLLAVGADWAWVTWLGPVVMLGFLYRVTGIPYAEAQALRSRGEAYRRYQQTTSAFVPLPPRPAALSETS